MAEVSVTDSVASSDSSPQKKRPRPLQIVKIDLETNSVVIGEEELEEIQEALTRTGCKKSGCGGSYGSFPDWKIVPPRLDAQVLKV